MPDYDEIFEEVQFLEVCAELSMRDPEKAMARLSARPALVDLTWIRSVIFMEAARNHLAQIRRAKRVANKVIKRVRDPVLAPLEVRQKGAR